VSLRFQEVDVSDRPGIFGSLQTGIEKRFQLQSHFLRLFELHLSSFAKDMSKYKCSSVYIWAEKGRKVTENLCVMRIILKWGIQSMALLQIPL
jgi:hypothetical protein